MMVVKISNYDTNEVIISQSMPEKTYRDVIRGIIEKQREEDILKLGQPCELVPGHNEFGLGIMEIYNRGHVWASCKISPDEGFSTAEYRGGSTFSSSDSADSNPKTPNTIKYYDENHNEVDSNLRIAFECCNEGFVMNLGFYMHSSGLAAMFGVSGGDAYFAKLTSRNIKYGKKAGAKLYTSPKKLLKDAQDKEWMFKTIKKNHDDMDVSIEYSCKMYEEYINGLPEKKRTKILNELSEATEWLNSNINTIENEKVDEQPVPEDLPEKADDEQMFQEALSRMEALGLYGPCINKFRQKKEIQVSERGGILFDISGRAQEVLDKFKEEYPGYLCYHMMHEVYRDLGDTYSLLVVSPDAKDVWHLERYDAKYHTIDTFCLSDATYDSFEIGSTYIYPVNGGVERG